MSIISMKFMGKEAEKDDGYFLNKKLLYFICDIVKNIAVELKDLVEKEGYV